MKVKRAPRTAQENGVWVVQVWLVTGYNDAEDIRMGGSPLLGPFMWVVEAYVKRFLAAMEKRYGNDPRVREIRIGSRDFHPCERLPTLQEQLDRFAKYLADERRWIHTE